MSETIKITTEELEAMRGIRQKFLQKIFNFGQIQLERFGIEANMDSLAITLNKLKDAEETLKKEYLDIQKEEGIFLDQIKEKYGEVTISLETGEVSSIVSK